jgi:hypothetical protein
MFICLFIILTQSFHTKHLKTIKKTSIHIIGFCLSSPTFYVPCQHAMMEQQQLAKSVDATVLTAALQLGVRG